MCIRHPTFITACSIVTALLTPLDARAGVQESGNFLNLDLAMEAATEAIHVCADHGWSVSVSVVDAAGNVKLQARGDHSTIHTKDASFRKAYTVVTMGPIFGFHKLGDWVDQLTSNPFAAAYASLPNIFLLPGAVSVDVKGETVAAIGVGGAPGGKNDEICAMAGLAKIQSRLPR
jgi:uncharacterized protein GlcG (DUF336 family)